MWASIASAMVSKRAWRGGGELHAGGDEALAPASGDLHEEARAEGVVLEQSVEGGAPHPAVGPLRSLIAFVKRDPSALRVA